MRPVKRQCKVKAENLPSSFELNGIVAYARMRLGSGTVIHLVGEDHALEKPRAECVRPRCLSIDEFLEGMVALSKASARQLDMYIERRASQIWNPDVTRSYGDPGKLMRIRNKYQNHIPVSRRPYTPLVHARIHVGDPRDVVFHPHVYALFEYGMNRQRLFYDSHVERPENDIRKNVNALLAGTYKRRTYKNTNEAQRLKGNPYIEEGIKRNETKKRTANTIVKSNSYGTNLPLNKQWRGRDEQRRVLEPFHRDATTYAGRSVSRIRKQILKLGHGLDEAMVQMYDLLYHSGYYHEYLLLADMYQIARLLYYAGYGKTKVKVPSKVAIAYVGFSHVSNQRNMLYVLDRLTGGEVLHLQEDVKVPKNPNNTFLVVRNFRSGFE
jgi:hypothetical protein